MHREVSVIVQQCFLQFFGEKATRQFFSGMSERSFLQLVKTRPVYVFFHEISKGQQRYPLFSVEIDAAEGSDAIELRSTRDLMMLNTPAVNSFEFDTVLTTPRACRFAESLASLSGIERFLQAKFKASDSFILQPHYRPLIAEDLPTIRFRIGLQAVKDEDRRILDYSELITSLDDGAGRKFTDLVGRYEETRRLGHENHIQNSRSQLPAASCRASSIFKVVLSISNRANPAASYGECARSWIQQRTSFYREGAKEILNLLWTA